MNIHNIISEEITNHFFNTKTTGMGYYDEMIQNPDYFREKKHREGQVVYMSPDDYIRKTKEGFGIYNDYWIDNESLKRLKDAISAGNKINMPVLDYYFYSRDNNFSQEGRHRALIAKQMGLKQIPVYVVNKAQ